MGHPPRGGASGRLSSRRENARRSAYCSSASLGLLPFAACLPTTCFPSANSGQAVGCILLPLCGFSPGLSLWRLLGWRLSSPGPFSRSDLAFDGAVDRLRALGARLGARLEKMPGFAMDLVLVVFFVRGEGNRGLPDQLFGGEEIPDIVGHDVDGEVVDLRRGIGVLMGGLEQAGVCRAIPAVGTFDLDAQEASVVFDGDVVTSGVAQGFATLNPRSAAWVMNRSSTHSPRCL